VACKVNEEFGDCKKCRVEVIDSGLCSMSLGMVVIAAAEAFQQGKTFEEVLKVVHTIKGQIKSYLAIPTLKYLKKNRKIGGLKSIIGLALGVKPVLEFNDGRMEIKTKLLGKQKNMILAMMDTIKRDVGPYPIDLSLIYSGEKELVQRLHDVFSATFDCRDIYIARFGPSIAINAGPDCDAVFFSPHS
jgi:DegV family protein with EDD domain